MIAEQIVMDEVRAKQCAADTVSGFLAIWIPLSEEQQEKTLAQLLPLRVGNRAKYEYIIRYSHELGHTVGAITKQVNGGLVIVLQEYQGDTRRANNVCLSHLNGAIQFTQAELSTTNLNRLRCAHIPTALDPNQQYLLRVDLKRH